VLRPVVVEAPLPPRPVAPRHETDVPKPDVRVVTSPPPVIVPAASERVVVLAPDPATPRPAEPAPAPALVPQAAAPVAVPLSAAPAPLARAAARAARVPATPAPEPAVHVTIGRIEVRAATPSAAPKRRTKPEPPRLALAEYLRERG
jgi:hypothetical protein